MAGSHDSGLAGFNRPSSPKRVVSSASAASNSRTLSLSSANPSSSSGRAASTSWVARFEYAAQRCRGPVCLPCVCTDVVAHIAPCHLDPVPHRTELVRPFKALQVVSRAQIGATN
eukprot:scaffold23292_cov72-Phaeocystis_antarctica.AAC.3